MPLPFSSSPRPVLCVGSALWDVIGTTNDRFDTAPDVPGKITRRAGGVAGNIALALSRLGMKPRLLTAFGGDADSAALRTHLEAAGIDTTPSIVLKNMRCDQYMAIEEAGRLVAAIADAGTLEAAGDALIAPLLDAEPPLPLADEAPLTVLVDGNLPRAALARLASAKLPWWYDLRLVPASPGKVGRLACFLRGKADGRDNGHRAVLYLNRGEAEILLGQPFRDAEGAAKALVAAGAMRAIVTDGPEEAVDLARGDDTPIRAHPPSIIPRQVTGAGDLFIAAHLAAEAAGRAHALEAACHAAARHVAGEPIEP